MNDTISRFIASICTGDYTKAKVLLEKTMGDKVKNRIIKAAEKSKYGAKSTKVGAKENK